MAALAPAAEAKPNNANCQGSFGNSISGFMSHDDQRRAVARLDRSPHIETEVVGHSNQGREIWTVRAGEGSTVMFIQGGIHGLEQHGTKAVLNLMQTLGDDSARSREIREALTVVTIPDINPDGSSVPQRQNMMPWSDVMEMHPQLPDQPRAWYFSNFRQGFDVNRDFNANLGYEPDPADLPGDSASFGFYITPEARTSRAVYGALESEFGLVDVFIDLHNQGSCHQVPDEERFSMLSISGRFLADPTAHGDWPLFDDDASRRINVAAYDALQRAGSGFGDITRYPQPPGLDLPGTALGSYALRGSAVMLFETSEGTNQNEMGFSVKQVEVGLTGIIDAITDGTLDDIDPDRYDEVPAR
ncbi:MAG: peptidase M14 [Propionibacteriales bacterium]|nr:peptidase M14 [Propionibacteriales bacterium]